MKGKKDPTGHYKILAELDQLRAQNANMRLDLEWPIVKERDALNAHNAKLTRQYDFQLLLLKQSALIEKSLETELHDLKAENEALKYRIAAIRKALQFIVDQGYGGYFQTLIKSTLMMDDGAKDDS